MLNNLQIKGGEFCVEKIPSSCGIVIFGASGDLTFRKLLPSLFNLFLKKLLPINFFVLGCARTEISNEEFLNKIKLKLSSLGDSDSINDFLTHCNYVQINYFEKESYLNLIKKIETLDENFKTNSSVIFYLSTPATLYVDITRFLLSYKESKIISKDNTWPRFIYEKPYGCDLQSALKLDKELHLQLQENQIYRIDHYLGKDTVQNILMFRFANSIFEPVWNNKYIDHVQITVSETLGVEHRTGYFEQAGLLRDMFQNHILQMISMLAMEPPNSFDADRIRDEKTKIFRSIRQYTTDSFKNDIVRGQYLNGINDDGKELLAYRQELNVNPNSFVETYVALKLFIDNWRWYNVPFYIKAGKRLKQKTSQIAVIFKPLPHSIFKGLSPTDLVSNVLIFSIQPDEGVSLVLQAKQPGPKLCMHPLMMEFKYSNIFKIKPPEAYERLLLDCMLGDQTLFVRFDGMELAWSILKPILDVWYHDKNHNIISPLEFYKSGSFGPDLASSLIQKDQREWLI